MAEYNYQVYGPAGHLVLPAAETCRYSPALEMAMLDAGYTIRLNGKRITKTDIRTRKEKR